VAFRSNPDTPETLVFVVELENERSAASAPLDTVVETIAVRTRVTRSLLRRLLMRCCGLHPW
jgi:hypothetical protein